VLWYAHICTVLQESYQREIPLHTHCVLSHAFCGTLTPVHVLWYAHVCAVMRALQESYQREISLHSKCIDAMRTAEEKYAAAKAGQDKAEESLAKLTADLTQVCTHVTLSVYSCIPSSLHMLPMGALWIICS
jgi:hypothetical protein